MEKRKNVHLKPYKDVLSDLNFQVSGSPTKKTDKKYIITKKVIQKKSKPKQTKVS